jgi:hypothetical protein
MKKLLISFTLLLFGFISEAQVFYKDIFLTRQHNDKFQLLKKAGVRAVQMTSLEADGSATEGFAGEQKIDAASSKMVTNMNVPLSGPSYLENHYDEKGRLIKTIDTTEVSSSITEYVYDDNNMLVTLTNSSYSNGQMLEQEVHSWKYNSNGQYTNMTKVRNGAETTIYTFTLDESGNIAEEKPVRGGKPLPAVFYYYDAQGRLTDVVRYNQKARRLLPDFVIEYNQNNQVSALMIVPEGSDDYQRWIYQYGDNGLRTKESCYNKRKQLLGQIRYEYIGPNG